jgi:dolichol-phosphate mannosyltransferase
MKKVSVVIPVYYNEESLPLLFTEILAVEQKLLEKKMQLELIFVDDGSGDGSLQELLKIKQQRQNVKVVKHTRNFGAVRASKTGLQFVTGDCFLFLAADLQDPPELILQMVEKWQAGTKYVIGARSERGDPIMTKIFAYLYYKLVRLFVVEDYPAGGAVALMDRSFLPYLQNSSKSIYTPLLAHWLGFQPELLHYKRPKRIHGKSRWTFFKKWGAFLDSILSFTIVPLRLISLVGLVVSIVSFGYGFWVVLNALFGNPAVTDVQGFATLVALISFLLGLIIIMLGVIGEYIWRIFDEVSKRPEAVIDEVY